MGAEGAVQQELVDEGLIAYAEMPGLRVSPFQGLGMEPDMNVPVFIQAFWGTSS